MKMNKIAFVVISALCLFTFFSCDLLTKPILPESILQFGPEASASLENVDTSSLADAAGDISIIADPEASKAVLEALGKKPASEIANLTSEQKQSILALTTSAILPVDTIVSVAYTIMSEASGSSGSSYARDAQPNNNQNDDASWEQLQGIIETVLKEISFVDTKATEDILNEYIVENRAPVDEELANVLFSTISIAISACKSGGELDINVTANLSKLESAAEKLIEFFENGTQAQAEVKAREVLNALLPSAGDTVNETGVRALKKALEVVAWLKTKNITLDSLANMFLGGMGE